MSEIQKPYGTFRDDARPDFDSGAVFFTLDFTDEQGKKRPITCKASQSALEDAARYRGKYTPAVALNLFKRFERPLKIAVDRKLKLAAFEKDGSIVVTTNDLDSAIRDFG